jgi:hypothetical protein
MPGTKKTPASLTLAGTATTRPMESPKGPASSLPPFDLEARVAALEDREHERIIGLAMMLVDLSAEVANTLQAFAEKAADAVAHIASKIAEGGSARTREAYSEFLNDQEAFLAKWRDSHGDEDAR